MKYLASFAPGVFAILTVPACAESPSEATSSWAAPSELAFAVDAGARPWMHDGLPPTPMRKAYQLPADDELAAAANEMTSFTFGDCVSEAPGQVTIRSTQALPVGRGRYLTCKTGPATPARTMAMLQASDDSLYCFYGAASEYRTGGDPRLNVQLIAAPADGKWTFRATASEAITIKQVSVNGFAAWPAWLEIHYTPVYLVPAKNAVCGEWFE